MARSKVRKSKRDASIRKDYKALTEKNKVERKYRIEYLIGQIADKYFLEPRTVYAILQGVEEEPDNQLSLFETATAVI